MSSRHNPALFACLLVTVLALTACSKSGVAAAPAGPPPLPVKIQIAQTHLVPESTDYLATIKSRNSSALQPQVEGDIVRIFVRSGEKVAAGTPVLEIDPRKQAATVNNQEAAYKSKLAIVQMDRLDLERKKQLFGAGVIAKADLDNSQAAYDSAQADAEALDAAIREQKEQLRYYTVRAPAAGIVGDIPVRVGDHVTNQSMLTTIDRGGDLEAYVYVPADKSSTVHLNLPLELMDDNGKTVLRAPVFFVSPEVDTASQTLLLKARIPSAKGFRNDQQVHARVIWAEKKSPLIPLTAVSRLSGKVFAFVAEGQGQQTVARQRLIRVGDVIGNDYVVLEGIQPGDRIIVSGVQILADGMPVAPQS
ncbi:MAG TPA: efflux RND transporter periplasmic adaptor subunit [Candidatus Angelobacter sp.]|nr:efflux RND transporter periplasmic adaptor subunit [Candidatus Angelobacter sp.]